MHMLHQPVCITLRDTGGTGACRVQSRVHMIAAALPLIVYGISHGMLRRTIACEMQDSVSTSSCKVTLAATTGLRHC